MGQPELVRNEAKLCFQMSDVSAESGFAYDSKPAERGSHQRQAVSILIDF